MCLLFIYNQGATIKKESRRIFAEKEDKELFEIQTRKISSVSLMGNVQITTQALELLADEGIGVTFLSSDGKLKGEFLPPSSKNLDLRLAQYRCLSDGSASFEVAKYFVVEKIKQYTQFYRKLQKNESIDNCKYLVDTFYRMSEEASIIDNYESLLGIEGMAARIHFNNFGMFFKNELTFRKRSSYPPEDETNALLSFGYSLLFKLITGMVHSSGLDVYCGFLHKEKYNRPSLVCDIEELFRVNYVDSFVLKLANLGMIKKKHFNIEGSSIRLNSEGLQIFLTNWKNLVYPYNNSELVKNISLKLEGIIKRLRGEEIFLTQESRCTSSLTI